GSRRREGGARVPQAGRGDREPKHPPRKVTTSRCGTPADGARPAVRPHGAHPMSRPIAGVLPIAHTPFTADDAIDYASLERRVDWALGAGADGYCTGMVSELLRLTYRERLELTRALGALARGRGVFVAGVGAESTRQAAEYAREAEAAGASAVMAIPPTT